MQKLLLQFDTSNVASVFDRIVGFDGGADQVLAYSGVTASTVTDLVHGAIFTRGPQDLHNTAIFIGGSSLADGERVLAAVSKTFFGPFRVSVMLDANGANTTAVAAVSRILEVVGDAHGRHVVVTGGSGPVGSRVAGLLAQAGADVMVTSRRPVDGSVAGPIAKRFNAKVTERTLRTGAEAAEILRGAEIVVNAGPASTCLVPRDAWATQSSVKVLVDLNAVPPAGIEGVEPGDKSTSREHTLAYGALGVGGLKMKLHKACVAKLFAQNDIVLDVETIADVARELTATRK